MQKKFYYIQRNVFIFRVALKKFSIFREIAYLKKLFYIQRKYCIYSMYLIREIFFFTQKMLILKKIGTFRENLEFKFQIIYHSRV